MSILCPGCGRGYDVSLFSFGRTLHCNCGARVGPEPRLGPPTEAGEPRFLADAMLGGLARWLRLLGFDVAYDPGLPDEELVRRSIVEGRHLLTRDRRLPEEWRVGGITLVKAEGIEAQLRDVLRRFHLQDRLRPFTRCSRCNTPLEDLSPETGGIPDPQPAASGGNRPTGKPFSMVSSTPQDPERGRPEPPSARRATAYCPSCGRRYWEGSHTRRMRIFLEKVLRPPEEAEATPGSF